MSKKFICGLVAVGSFGFLLLAARDNAFIGTWNLNLAKSSSTVFDNNGKLVKREAKDDDIAVVTVEGETTTVRGHGTTGGQPHSGIFTMPTSGGPLNFTEGAPPAGITDVLKIVDDRTEDVISTMNGKVVLTTHVVVSADHKKMIIRTSGVDEKGKAFKTLDAYDRR